MHVSLHVYNIRDGGLFLFSFFGDLLMLLLWKNVRVLYLTILVLDVDATI